MIRVLIIGRQSAEWGKRLEEDSPAGLEVETARMPAAGIRQFELTPPDIILITDERGGPRVETLVAAIRNRPLGQLVPLVLICPQPTEGPVLDKIDELELAGWLPAEASAGEVLRLIERELDVELDQAEAGNQAVEFGSVATMTGDDPREPAMTGDYTLESLDDPPSLDRPLDDRRGFFGQRHAGSPAHGRVDSEEILRKLRSVRHEDYYAVLEVHRGAESQTIREAFHRLYARYDAHAIEFELSHRYQLELDEIRDALEDAWAVLGDPDLRKPYLTHTLRK